MPPLFPLLPLLLPLLLVLAAVSVCLSLPLPPPLLLLLLLLLPASPFRDSGLLVTCRSDPKRQIANFRPHVPATEAVVKAHTPANAA